MEYINKMKAAVRNGRNMIFKTDYAKPVCGPKNILVQVKAAGINPVDYKVGWPIMGPVVGIDFAGVIVEKGESVTDDFNVGDEVYGSAGKNGSLAEFTLVDPKSIAKKPESASFAEAGCMSVTYTTSLQGLRDYGKMQEGDRVLIIGASGGCGTAAVQLAKSMGAKDIVGVCSGKNAELVKSLGATDIVDYTKQTIKEFCLDGGDEVAEDKKFDVVYDAATNSGAGEDYKNTSLELLKNDGHRHGQYVAINGYTSMWLRYFTIGCKANEHLFLAKSNTADFEYLAKLVDGGMKPIIAENLPLNEENLKKGFSLLKSRRVVGKVVFNMDE